MTSILAIFDMIDEVVSVMSHGKEGKSRNETAFKLIKPFKKLTLHATRSLSYF